MGSLTVGDDNTIGSSFHSLRKQPREVNRRMIQRRHQGGLLSFLLSTVSNFTSDQRGMNSPVVSILEGKNVYRNTNMLAVLPLLRGFVILDVLSLLNSFDEGSPLLGALGWYENGDGFPDDFRSSPAIDAFCPRIPTHDDSVRGATTAVVCR